MVGGRLGWRRQWEEESSIKRGAKLAGRISGFGGKCEEDIAGLLFVLGLVIVVCRSVVGCSYLGARVTIAARCDQNNCP